LRPWRQRAALALFVAALLTASAGGRVPQADAASLVLRSAAGRPART
jgi:hypothetical protein